MKVLKLLLLWPFSLLYSVIITLRNYKYLKFSSARTRFSVPVVVVGNLTVGGTGKTPHVEYLTTAFMDKVRLGLLSRGYGRASKGFVLANKQSTAKEIGDEPMQYVNKFLAMTQIAVCENRVLGIEQLELRDKGIKGYLLDDAFQHLRLEASTYILLTDYKRLFTEDYVLPSGLLREPRGGAARADVVVVTKCPKDLTFVEQKEIELSINRYTKAPVFFSVMALAQPVNFNSGQVLGSDETVFLLSGIAQNRDFYEQVSQAYKVKHHFEFSDHHAFDIGELKAIVEKVIEGRGVLVTTEKDFMRLKSPEFKEIISKIAIFVVPLTVEFLDKESEFLSIMSKAFRVSE